MLITSKFDNGKTKQTFNKQNKCIKINKKRKHNL